MSYELLHYNDLTVKLHEKIKIVSLEKKTEFHDVIGFYKINQNDSFNRFFIKFNQKNNNDIIESIKQLKYIEKLSEYNKKKLGFKKNDEIINSIKNKFNK